MKHQWYGFANQSPVILYYKHPYPIPKQHLAIAKDIFGLNSEGGDVLLLVATPSVIALTFPNTVQTLPEPEYLQS